MKVLHVVGREMEEIDPEGDTYEFLDGDVYVIDNGNSIYIWRGKDCGVDEQTVGAWVSNQLDNTERGGEPEVISLLQGEETDEFNELMSFNVVDGDTPGFLRQAQLDLVDYKMWKIFIESDTGAFDDAEVEEVELSKNSLTSDDVFVLDGNENIYMFVGKNSQLEEKFEGQKVMQKIDSERNYLPLTYTIYEGEGGKTEAAFYEMIEKAAKSEGPVVSVEDQRELEYRPEKSMDAETFKKESTDIDTSKKGPEKKSLWQRLLGIFK